MSKGFVKKTMYNKLKTKVKNLENKSPYTVTLFQYNTAQFQSNTISVNTTQINKVWSRKLKTLITKP